MQNDTGSHSCGTLDVLHGSGWAANMWLFRWQIMHWVLDSSSCQRDTPANEETKRELCIPDWTTGMAVRHFLIVERCGKAQWTLGGATPGQVVLHCIRKQVVHMPKEQTSKCSPCTSSSCLTSLRNGLCLGNVRWNKPFLPIVGSGQCFITIDSQPVQKLLPWSMGYHCDGLDQVLGEDCGCLELEWAIKAIACVELNEMLLWTSKQLCWEECGQWTAGLWSFIGKQGLYWAGWYILRIFGSESFCILLGQLMLVSWPWKISCD